MNRSAITVTTTRARRPHRRAASSVDTLLRRLQRRRCQHPRRWSTPGLRPYGGSASPVSDQAGARAGARLLRPSGFVVMPLATAETLAATDQQPTICT